jgi:NAD(P)-dependent dehydrogenase (short-subunit alcohol dehydrogenase family)
VEASGPALVTGASRGIGRAVALELAARGFEVVATMRDPASGKDLAEAGLRVEALDVDRPGSFAPPVGLRVLVNNAGIEGPQRPLEATPIEAWRRIFETNVFGLVEIIRRALPALRETRGVVCNITSCSILAPVPFFAAYRASKAAVSALGESLRTELAGTGVRVLEVQPGAIRTDMLAGSEGPPETGTLEAYQRVAEHFQRLRDATRDQFEEVDVAARAIVDGILDDTAMHRLAPDAMSAGMLAAWRASDDETILRGFLAALGEGARD